MTSFTGPIKPREVSASIQLSEISLSPDGCKVIYVYQPICKEDQNTTALCSIWIAETDKPGTECRLSSAAEQPSSPAFHPNRQMILYLTDIHQPGGPAQIYSVDASGDSKPTLLCGESKQQPITLFSISPNGEHVAFTSADEETEERATNDVKIFGSDSQPERLRVYTFATGKVHIVGSTNNSDHVNGFAWSPDSCELLFYTWPANRAEDRESSMPSDETTIGIYITGIEESSSPRCIGRSNQSPGPWERQSFLWPSLTEAVTISKYELFYRPMDGMATHWHPLYKFEPPVRGGGDTDNPDSMIDLHFQGYVAILVLRGMSTFVEIWKDGKHVTTLLELRGSALSTTSGCWDIKRLSDGTFKIAVIRSSAIDHQSEEIWVTAYDSSRNLTFGNPLTAHNKQLDGLHINTMPWKWENEGITLQGTITYPPAFNPDSGPLATVLLIHSGPYSRTTLDFKLDKFRLQLFLASHGYLVLCPNYRGSSGRGSAFARVSGLQLITESWSDCDSMIDRAISLQLTDPNRLALAGHSSGGYLAALGASITKDKYKTCITWSGASDLSSLAGTSQTPEFQFSMSGLAPWHAESGSLLQNVGGRMVHPSPVRNLEDVETAFLILHGEKDPQIPVAQAVMLFRGLRRLSKFPERHLLAVYPREGHVFAEKAHLENALERMLDYLGKYVL